MLELPIDAFRQHDHPHAAAAQFALYPPITDDRSGRKSLGISHPIDGDGEAQLGDVHVERAAGGIRHQQGGYFMTKLWIIAASSSSIAVRSHSGSSQS